MGVITAFKILYRYDGYRVSNRCVEGSLAYAIQSANGANRKLITARAAKRLDYNPRQSCGLEHEAASPWAQQKIRLGDTFEYQLFHSVHFTG